MPEWSSISRQRDRSSISTGEPLFTTDAFQKNPEAFLIEEARRIAAAAAANSRCEKELECDCEEEVCVPHPSKMKFFQVISRECHCKLPLKWDREKREDSDFSTRNRTMKRSRFTESQIVAILKEADAGVKVTDVCRRQGISQSTYYSWKSRYGGLGVSELKRIKELKADRGTGH